MLIKITFKEKILSLNFIKNKVKEVHISDGLSKDYEYDFSYENLYNIYCTIKKIDSTVHEILNKYNEYSWIIDLNKYPKITANFKSLIPKFIRKIYIENILMDFQIIGSNWLLKENDRILADDMGLGKSLQSIYGLEKLIFKQKISSILIFCSNTLTRNWTDELIKWSPLLSTKEIEASDINKNTSITKFFNKHNVLIIPYSLVKNIVDSLDIKKHNFDIIIADEAHKLRNRSSALHKSFIKLNKTKTWFLTGTPLERDSNDIKNLLVCLNKKKFFVNKNIDNSILQSRLRLNSLRRLKKDVLDKLPKVSHHIEELEMIEEQHIDYKKLEKDMLISSGKEKIGFLSQLSLAAICTNKGKSNKFFRAIELSIANHKLKKKIIIFCDYNEPLRLLQNKLSKINILSHFINGDIDSIDRFRMLRDFKSNNLITVLLCNSKIGREGLNLTEASTMVFLNEWWNPSSNRQAEDRINRIGQKEEIQIYLLRSKNTIDIHVASILGDKNIVEKDFLDQLLYKIKT